MLKIHKIRLGLACNSSSSHSLILLPEGVNLEDDWGWGVPDEEVSDDYDLGADYLNQLLENEKKRQEEALNGKRFEFGWNWFTASSDNTKRHYLGIVLWSQLRRNLPVALADSIMRDWLGITLPDDDDYGLNCYIDHQSHWSLPCEFGTTVPDKEFFDILKDFVLNDRLVILGGNDNDDRSHHHLSKGEPTTTYLPEDDTRTIFVCRRDPVYDYWVFFWPDTGAKLRVTLGKDKIAPERASVPELVDVKINDYCPFKCEFCYQGSTSDAGHANRNDIIYLFRHLCKNKVFEVALGGGEPTMHPEFLKILKDARENGIVPNFTTKNLAWLKDKSYAQKVMDQAGNFAFSVDKAEDIEMLAALLKVNDISPSRVSVQIVMGTLTQWEFENIVKTASAAEIRLTLLGYKTTGRGGNFKPQKYQWWLDSIQKVRLEGELYNLCIDTALAKEYEEEILSIGIPSYVFETEEGKFSMYVDCVQKKAGPSSYCDPSQMIEWDFTNCYGENTVQLPDVYLKLS